MATSPSGPTSGTTADAGQMASMGGYAKDFARSCPIHAGPGVRTATPSGRFQLGSRGLHEGHAGFRYGRTERAPGTGNEPRRVCPSAQHTMIASTPSASAARSIRCWIEGDEVATGHQDLPGTQAPSGLESPRARERDRRSRGSPALRGQRIDLVALQSLQRVAGHDLDVGKAHRIEIAAVVLEVLRTRAMSRRNDAQPGGERREIVASPLLQLPPSPSRRAVSSRRTFGESGVIDTGGVRGANAGRPAIRPETPAKLNQAISCFAGRPRPHSARTLRP